MAASNQERRLVLATGNKSELSLGYCTLYGDTVGGLAVLGDQRDVGEVVGSPARCAGRRLGRHSAHCVTREHRREQARHDQHCATSRGLHRLDPAARYGCWSRMLTAVPGSMLRPEPAQASLPHVRQMTAA